MANRISRETAELLDFPPMTWYVKKVSWLLEQETFCKYYTNVPVQESLLESMLESGIKAPILTMNNWYPICGSQRLRACKEIQERDPSAKVLQQEIRVARLDGDPWNFFHLWSEKDFKSKAIQVYIQMLELGWKSIHFIEENPEEMIRFEVEGDKLKWKARDS